jgi:peptidoglycan/LPS O-acetylase OafA/YrhL
MLNSIQILRALAAWLVVGHHYMQLFYNHTLDGIAPHLLRDFGAIGVDLFFVISGFVIYGSTISKPTTPKSFAANRIARVAPAYWLFSSITAITLIYAPDSIPLTAFEPVFFLKSLFFIPAQNPSGVGLYPLMTVGWTLNYEASFYLVFFSALFLPAAYRVIGLFLGVIALQLAAKKMNGAISFYGNAMVWEFLFGVALSIAYKRGMVTRTAPIAGLLMMLGALFVIAHFGPVTHSPLRSGLPCAAILYACLSQERLFPKHNFIARLGDWSYSTYLCHVLIICAAIKVNEHFATNHVLLAFGVIAAIALTSYASFTLVEMPISRAAKRIQARMAKTKAVPQANQ